ncbi:MAG: ABC transporter permease [Acidobacteriaceae bacterium]|nr:ABC transporter permease [Acidobacteriaceae bacterium]
MQSLGQDIRYALHLFRRNPGFTLTAVITLALGIGCNVGVFSFAYAFLLTPSPFAHSEQIALIRFEQRLQRSVEDLSPADYTEFREATHNTFQSVAGFDLEGFNLSGAGLEPERVQGARVSSDFFPLFGVKPAEGRSFLPEETSKSQAQVVVISNGLWQRRYAADPNIIGKNIRLEGTDYRVIGIMPPRFHVPLMGAMNVWVPLVLGPRERFNRADRSIAIFARVSPGVTIAQARATLDRLARGLERRFPATHNNLGFRVLPYAEAVARQSGENGIRVLLWVVACLLLIACTNVANLVLARSINRRREIAVRLALGVGRWRLARQLVTEGILLFLAGGAVSLLVAAGMTSGIGSRLPESLAQYLPNYGRVGLNYPVLGYALGIALLAGILFSVSPALRLSTLDVHEVLKEISRGSSGTLRLGLWRDLLVIGEIAMTLTVFVISGLLCRDLLAIYSVSLGFDPHHVFLGRLSLPQKQYPNDDRIRQFFNELLSRAQSIQQAESAAISEFPPFGGWTKAVRFELDGIAARPDAIPSTLFNPVSPDYLQVLRLRLLRGRGIDSRDDAGQSPVGIINRTFADRYLSGRDPLGHTIQIMGDSGQSIRIVGLVEDASQFEPGERPRPMLLASYRQFPSREMHLLLRSRSSADASAAQAMLAAVEGLDRDLAFSRISSLDTLIAEQMAANRLMVIWMIGFAVLAVVLSVVGIYGVISYVAGSRTQEFGIRMTLGATANDILRRVTVRGLCLLLPGLVLGLGGAWLSHFVVRAVLAKTSPSDPLTLATSTLLFAACALLACIVPAIRAARIPPMQALHYE